MRKSAPSGVYIPQIDGKDLYISNNYFNENLRGYKLRNINGELNLSRFLASLDYSLDLIKLREIYKKQNFSFNIREKEYTQHVISVTFKYSDKEYNRIKKGLYIKSGYSIDEINVIDGVCIINDEVIAVQTYEPLVGKNVSKEDKAEWDRFCAVEIPSPILPSYFYYEDGKYKAKKNIKPNTGVAEIRSELYKNGFMCDGIKYVRWKRSSGSARLGKCLFINESLYKKMHKWECCGIKIAKNRKIDLASWEAYISLTLSSIINTMELNPENFLVVDDYTSIFKDTVMATECIEGKLMTNLKEVDVDNSIWDGQSLMDISMFGNYSRYGMLLLRNRFFKSCCFNTNLQKWFSDNKIDSVSQLNGFTLAKDIKDIKIVTTPSSIKYLKFGTMEEFFENMDTKFGIVKHDKPTHYFDGRMVQTHYQLLNTIQLSHENVGELVKPSLDYIRIIADSPAVLRYHIKYQIQDYTYPQPMANENDIVYRLLGINEDFAKTDMYKKFRDNLVKSMTRNLRRGHVLVRGNYSTLFGNPMEMLKYSIHQFDGKTSFVDNTVHSLNFDDGEELLGSRSPHVAIGNIVLAKNKIYEDIDKYFNLTKEIVCVNSIDENLLERCSGSDESLSERNPVNLEI